MSCPGEGIQLQMDITGLDMYLRTGPLQYMMETMHGTGDLISIIPEYSEALMKRMTDTMSDASRVQIYR